MLLPGVVGKDQFEGIKTDQKRWKEEEAKVEWNKGCWDLNKYAWGLCVLYWGASNHSSICSCSPTPTRWWWWFQHQLAPYQGCLDHLQLGFIQQISQEPPFSSSLWNSSTYVPKVGLFVSDNRKRHSVNELPTDIWALFHWQDAAAAAFFPFPFLVKMFNPQEWVTEHVLVNAVCTTWGQGSGAGLIKKPWVGVESTSSWLKGLQLFPSTLAVYLLIFQRFQIVVCFSWRLSCRKLTSNRHN